MNNDLISREALKKALNANCDTLCPDKNTNWCEHCCPHNDFEDLIDNAPAVEPRDNFDLGYVQGLEDGKNDRPQGEWIFRNGVTCIGYYKCSNCGEVERAEKNFCPNCGAKMGGST